MALTTQEIAKKAPSALIGTENFELFRTNAQIKVSDKYRFLSTASVIDEMMEMGWHVADANQTSLTPGGIHEVIFESNELQEVFPISYGLVPRIHFLNAHHGRFAVRSYKGVFRQVCSNGLVAETKIGMGKVAHVGTVRDKVNHMISDYIDNLKEIKGRVIEASQTAISSDQAMGLVNVGLKARGIDSSKINPMDLLVIRRDGDGEATVWNVFNRVQESIIKGGFLLNLGKYEMEASEITNPVKLAKINVNLWTEMENILGR